MVNRGRRGFSRSPSICATTGTFVLERRWLVVFTFAVVMVLCLFYLFTATSIFSATTRLQIDNETENAMRMESFVMEGNQGQDYLQTQYKNLQSRSLMKTVLLETEQNAKILEGIKSGKRTPSQLGELSGLATGQVKQRLQKMAIAGFFWTDRILGRQCPCLGQGGEQATCSRQVCLS